MGQTMKPTRIFVLCAVVFGAGLLCGHWWQSAQAVPVVIDADPKTPIIRKHTSQIEDLQAFQQITIDRLDKLDPPPGKDKLPGQN